MTVQLVSIVLDTGCKIMTIQNRENLTIEVTSGGSFVDMLITEQAVDTFAEILMNAKAKFHVLAAEPDPDLEPEPAG